MLVNSQSIDITPQKPAYLSGLASRKECFTGVHLPLEINGFALKDELNDRKVLVLSFDLLYVGAVIVDALESFCELKHGMSKDQIFLIATHTHYAPATDYKKPKLGAVADDYVDYVIEQAKRLIQSLFQDEFLFCDNLSYGHKPSFQGVNRRRNIHSPRHFFLRHTLMRPNPEGFIDRKVRVIALNNNSGDPITILWNYSCHPTGYPNVLDVSSEYIGMVRQDLRERYGNIPIIFLPAFSGDVRPNLVRPNKSIKDKAVEYIVGQHFGVPSFDEWKKWCAPLTESVYDALHASEKHTINSFASKLKEIPIDDLFDKVEQKGSLPKHLQIKTLTLGTLAFVAVNAEVLGKFTSFMSDKVIPVAYMGDVFGYLPYYDDISFGGYEVDEFMADFSFKAIFKKMPIRDITEYI